ncbi:DUF3099 domain-containing protein [Streptomyces sp. NPDC049813]|uniref:DUF3099 domain-containing protein n=1 Tax=Streptomyces sp. NPDC049813 TaxID=3365597 RepID=UPI00378EE0D3
MPEHPRHRDTADDDGDGGGGGVPAITAARPGLTQNVRGRQRRYVQAMLVRTVCFVVMVAVWDRWPVLGLCALAGGIGIPYVAVVAAQAEWRQGRGPRPALAPLPAAPAAGAALEPTLILPPEQRTTR